jgi:hypothetical protein
MPALDVGKLLVDIQNAARPILERDIRTIQGFSETQLRALGQFAATLAAGIASGQISKDVQPFMLRSLEDMTKHFVDVLHGLAIVLIEKLINAIVDVAVKAIATASGVALKVV